MREAGAQNTFWTTSPPIVGSMADRPGGRTPISRHIMGGARMGDDPATSVFDRWQRLHGVENVVCTDSSVFPTSTGYGPTRTRSPNSSPRNYGRVERRGSRPASERLARIARATMVSVGP